MVFFFVLVRVFLLMFDLFIILKLRAEEEVQDNVSTNDLVSTACIVANKFNTNLNINLARWLSGRKNGNTYIAICKGDSWEDIGSHSICVTLPIKRESWRPKFISSWISMISGGLESNENQRATFKQLKKWFWLGIISMAVLVFINGIWPKGRNMVEVAVWVTIGAVFLWLTREYLWARRGTYISWNCRGLTMKKTINDLKTLSSKKQANIIFVIEIKMDLIRVEE